MISRNLRLKNSKSVHTWLLLVLLLVNLSGTTSIARAAAAKTVATPSAQSHANSGILGKSTKSKSTILLAQNGKALKPIIIAGKASNATKAVAAELAEYLQRITGATFDVKTGDSKSGIVLGTLADFHNPDLAQGLQTRNTFDGREAFSISTEPQRLRLIGATDLAVPHAAARFLELLGYRHFFPAPEWEVVPSIATLRFDRNEIDRPALLARRIWYGYGFFPDEGKPENQYRSFLDTIAWRRHNRMAASMAIDCSHAWQEIISQNKATFDAHPEYLALVSGKRQGLQLCVSNPALRQVVVDYALNYFKKHLEADMVSVDPMDGGGHCECDNCKRLGSISDRVFGLANTVARAVANEYPDKLVGLLAYNYHSEPPSFALEPNVHVQLTAGMNRGQYSFEELAELWSQKCQNMGFYEYFSVYNWNWDMLPGGRGADIAYIRKQIPRYVSLNATSVDAESGNNWGLHGRGYYIANKLMWNPKADVDALLADFYAKAFGPAAAPVKRYYERVDLGNKPMMSEHLLALAFRDIDEASRLAKDRGGRPLGAVQARLDHLKQYLRYVHLYWQFSRETDKEKREPLALAMLTHAYRTRYSYMNHWEWMRQFGEEAWGISDASPNKLWAVEAAYTREETERLFQEGLKYFQPQQIDEKTFSNDLIPVKFEGSPSLESYQHYQYGLRYALYSIRGEPLSVKLSAGTMAHYRDNPKARYKIVDALGKTIAEARLPLDGELHEQQIKVPKAGLYYLEMDDSGAGWVIRAAPDRPCAIVLERNRAFAHEGHMRPTYFYVPKGTRHIQYYWSGGPHTVRGPDGQVVQEVKVNGGFVKIDVPIGADGQPWHFTQLALGHLWFFNIPNYLASSPNALLLPREVVAKDGLKSVP